MTYGGYDQGSAGPQYPYGPPPTGPYYPHAYPAPGGAGYPGGDPGGYPGGPAYPGPGYPSYPGGPGYPGPGYPPPPQDYPPTQTNPLATLSIVFAFLFSPVGAVLGHVALGQIRQRHQSGRDRALIGLTLSYTFIVVTVVGLVLWAVAANNSAGSSSVAATTPGPVSAPTSSVPSSAAPAPVDVAKVLLTLDEVRQIMNTPGMAELPDSTPGSESPDRDVSGDPPECAGAVAPGINTVYDNSGASGFKQLSFGDPSTTTMVEQVAASFDSPTAARKFVAQNTDQWRQCAGKRFTISTSSGSLSFDIGDVTMRAGRANLQNTLTAKQEIPQYRMMGAKGDVVFDLAVYSRNATTEPDRIANSIMAKIPS
jgi:hypothetical protein